MRPDPTADRASHTTAARAGGPTPGPSAGRGHPAQRPPGSPVPPGCTGGTVGAGGTGGTRNSSSIGDTGGTGSTADTDSSGDPPDLRPSTRHFPSDGEGHGRRERRPQLLEASSQLGRRVALVRVRRTGQGQHLVQRAKSLVGGKGYVDPPHQCGDGGVAREGDLPGDRLVEHQGQGVDVSAPIERLALHLLGRGVPGRPQDGAGRLRPGRFGQGPGQAEVGDPQPVLAPQEQVRRLDVPVHEPPAMGIVEPGCRLHAHLHRLFRRKQRPGVEHLAQAPPERNSRTR